MACNPPELARLGSSATPLREIRAVFRELHHAIVADVAMAVGHEDVTVFRSTFLASTEGIMGAMVANMACVGRGSEKPVMLTRERYTLQGV